MAIPNVLTKSMHPACTYPSSHIHRLCHQRCIPKQKCCVRKTECNMSTRHKVCLMRKDEQTIQQTEWTSNVLLDSTLRNTYIVIVSSQSSEFRRAF